LGSAPAPSKATKKIQTESLRSDPEIAIYAKHCVGVCVCVCMCVCVRERERPLSEYNFNF
jgi:hypothetical protein